MAQQSTALSAVPDLLGLIPRTHMVHNHLYITLVPEDLTPSSGF